jgi:hypothetical protein
MNSVSAIRPVHKTWLVIVAKVVVVLQALAIVYLLTSFWVTVGVAFAFVATVSIVRALSLAAHQVDTIFEEELAQEPARR